MEHIEELTSLEALGIAIRDLIEDQKVYKNLSDRTKNDILKNRIKNLLSEEKVQQKLLESRYKTMFPNVELVIPPSENSIDFIDDVECSIESILNKVISRQKKAREYYLDLAESISDLSGKRCLRFIADMKFSHQMMLTAELDMIEKYPSYFKTSSGWDMEQRLKTDRIKK